MNESQTRSLIGMLLAAYPREAMNQETVGVWSHMIQGFEYDECRAAVLRIVATRYTFPTISDVRNEIVEARLELPSPERAYEQWRSRSQDSGERQLVHPFVREVAMDAGFDLWTMRTTEKPSVLRSQFIKAYEERRKALIREENLLHLGEGVGYAARIESRTMAAVGPASERSVGEGRADEGEQPEPAEGS